MPMLVNLFYRMVIWEDFEYFECLFLYCGYLVDVIGAKLVMNMMLEMAVKMLLVGLEVGSKDLVVLELWLSFVWRWMLEVVLWVRDGGGRVFKRR